MITFLLGDTSLSPRVQLVLAQADALAARGHDVRIVTTDEPVTWRASRAQWEYVASFAGVAGDLLLSTADETDVVAGAVRFPWSEFLIVDEAMYRQRAPHENEPLLVLLAGASHDEAGGVGDGYGAAAHARWFHQTFELIRAAPWAPSREEPLDGVQEFHVALTSAEATRLMHSCDAFIAPNRREEPAGLAAAEALAACVPVVMTSIPAFAAWGTPADFALFAPEDNAVELGEKLIELLSDEALRARLRTRGREVAEQWRSENVADRLEAFLNRLRR